MITRGQCRQARQLLGWDYGHLAAASKVYFNGVVMFEYELSQPRPETLRKLRTTFELAGVEFVDDCGGPGVRLRKDGVP